jgi:hypothetical protein
MAFYTLILVVIALSALALWQRLSQKKKIPKGLKELPGPKGKPSWLRITPLIAMSLVFKNLLLMICLHRLANYWKCS